MNAPITEDASAAAARPAGKPHKAGKAGKPPKDARRSKGEPAGGDSAPGLQEMAAELSEMTRLLARLRSDVDSLRGSSGGGDGAASPPSPTAAKPNANGKASRRARESDILAAFASDGGAVAVAVRDGGGDTPTPYLRVAGDADLLAAETSRVVQLGSAFSSEVKVALLRLLLEHGEQSAAQLGEAAGLTAGSLYHHLRELVRAGVVEAGARGKYVLTPLGRRACLVLLALAGA